MENRKTYRVSYFDYNDDMRTIEIRSSIKKNIFSQLKKIIDNLTYDNVRIVNYEVV